MTEGGDQGRQYGDQYREQSFPPPPAAPWADQPSSYGEQGGQPRFGQPGAQPGFAQPGFAQPGGQPPAQEPFQQPYGQHPPYGQEPYDAAPSYQQQQYGQTPWGTPPPGYGAPSVEYASWGARAGALLLDALFTLLMYLPGLIVLGIGVATGETEEDVNGPVVAVGGLLLFAALIVQFWNLGWRQGSRGWSWGKQVVGIKLVRVTDAQPPGGGLGLGRLLLRAVLGNVTAGIYTILTYLWPLWDDRNQSLDDKILGTLVIRAR